MNLQGIDSIESLDEKQSQLQAELALIRADEARLQDLQLKDIFANLSFRSELESTFQSARAKNDRRHFRNATTVGIALWLSCLVVDVYCFTSNIQPLFTIRTAGLVPILLCLLLSQRNISNDALQLWGGIKLALMGALMVAMSFVTRETPLSIWYLVNLAFLPVFASTIMQAWRGSSLFVTVLSLLLVGLDCALVLKAETFRFFPVPQGVGALLFLVAATGTLGFAKGFLAEHGSRRNWLASRVMELQESISQVLYKRLELTSLRDELTGLWNERFLNQVGEMLFEQAKRTGTSIAVLSIDADKFKDINDKFGHKAGDLALQHIANSMTLVLGNGRSSDVAVRLHGDEFLMLLPGCDGLNAQLRAGQLKTMVNASDLVAPDGRRFRVAVSVGAKSILPNKASRWEDLYQSGDQELYVDKRARKKTDDSSSPAENSEML